MNHDEIDITSISDECQKLQDTRTRKVRDGKPLRDLYPISRDDARQRLIDEGYKPPCSLDAGHEGPCTGWPLPGCGPAYQPGDGRCSECDRSIPAVEDAFCVAREDWSVRGWADANPGDKVICRKCVTPAKVYLMGNRLIAAFNAGGKQIAPLQGRFTEVVGKILHFATAETIFHGWPDIVDGGRLGDWRYR